MQSNSASGKIPFKISGKTTIDKIEFKLWINFKCFDKLVGFKSLITIVRHDWGFHMTTLHRTLNCIKIQLNDGSLKNIDFGKRGENGKWILMVGLVAEKMVLED